MFAQVGFMVTGVISILNGADVKQADYSASMQIAIGIALIDRMLEIKSSQVKSCDDRARWR